MTRRNRLASALSVFGFLLLSTGLLTASESPVFGYNVISLCQSDSVCNGGGCKADSTRSDGCAGSSFCSTTSSECSDCRCDPATTTSGTTTCSCNGGTSAQ